MKRESDRKKKDEKTGERERIRVFTFVATCSSSFSSLSMRIERDGHGRMNVWFLIPSSIQFSYDARLDK